MNLEFLGAGAHVRGAFEHYASEGLILGRVATAQRDRYLLYTESGECPAEASGALWYRAAGAADLPVAGDWVAARAASVDLAIVEAVLPRRTCFSRQAAGRRRAEQPIAANIDAVLVVCGLDGDFNLRRLERYLTLAAASGAQPVVVLNKSDLCGDLAERRRQVAEVAGQAPVVALSARENRGMEGLAKYLGPGRTVALVGSSGAGKSTLVNRLLGEERLATAEVRADDSRGRHTTTRRELIALPAGGAIVDTPGMREIQLWAGEDDVGNAFDEIARLAAGCRYRDCSHSGEPGCAVAAALAEGALDPGRWTGYQKLLGEARRHAEATDPLAANARKQRDKRLHKMIRRYYHKRD